ncbi:hypothetical protein V8F06_014800 [Rhypophila decipiens]
MDNNCLAFLPILPHHTLALLAPTFLFSENKLTSLFTAATHIRRPVATKINFDGWYNLNIFTRYYKVAKHSHAKISFHG